MRRPMTTIIAAAAQELGDLGADIQTALDNQAVVLYRYAARRLYARGMTRDAILEVLREAIPCHQLLTFRVTGWAQSGVSPGQKAILETLPAALASLTTGCAISQAHAARQTKSCNHTASTQNCGAVAAIQ